MKFIEDMPPMWVDENYAKLPPSIGSVIAETIKGYLKKYEHAEYMSRDDYREMMRWKRSLNIYEDELDEEL